MTLFRIIICFLLFNKINAGEVLSDEEYYNKGVSLYDKGAFDESFIVFFNLAEKGHNDSIFNLSNMYYEGVGTIQNYKLSLKYCWLCILNGNKRCLKKVDKIKSKLSENVVEEIANQIPEILEKNFIEFNGVYLPEDMSIEFQKPNSDRPRIVVYEQKPNSKFKLRVLYLQLVMMAGR